MPVAENDLLVVHGREGRELLIPLTQTICLDIDVDKRTIIIDPPEGLLDLDEI
jgi:16S rRNA processing protein RimM